MEGKTETNLEMLTRIQEALQTLGYTMRDIEADGNICSQKVRITVVPLPEEKKSGLA